MKSQSTDTLFKKYDAVFVGLNYGLGLHRLDFEFMHTDTTTDNPYPTNMSLDLNANSAAGISVKSKYFSFYIHLKPVSDALNKNASFIGDWQIPRKTNLGYTFYFKQFAFSGSYVLIKGALYNDYSISAKPHYTLMREFRSRQINLGVDYYFNRKFSFSKAHSFLYFPKKTLFSFSISTDFENVGMTNNGNAFLAGYGYYNSINDTSYLVYEWDHAKKINYSGLTVLPGCEVFLTRNSFKKPQRKAAFFYNIGFNLGPYFVFGNLETKNSAYQKEGFNTGLALQLIGKDGINIGNFYFEIMFGLYHKQYRLEDFKHVNFSSATGLTIGYRIPSKRPYQFIDNKLNKLFNRETADEK